ncbi:hypothetical protein [Halorarius halobius]|uniref:hypothetical protein n=1 Tax=Halorarius halobius TaxID=2962671 RepID=UPI0020CC021E|nr:hypothetical protein [Halorarius halobius]
MSSDSSAAGRRVMDRLGEQRRIPLLNIEEGDVGVALGFPIAGLFAASLVADVLVVPFVLVGLTVGVALVYAAPPHRTAWTWLRDVTRFTILRPRMTLSRPADSDPASTEGGAVQYTPFTPSERTQDLTSIERAWPGAGAVEREDGTMEAFLEVDPANMDFAMSGDWQAVQEAGEGFANAELQFPLTVHATTRSFPADQLVTQLEDRMDDPDVQSNPAFEELLEEYRQQRPAELADTRQHRYYLGVEVSPLEVYNRYTEEPTPGEKLLDIPVVGVLFTPFVTRRADLAAAERRQAMFEKLDDRVRRLRTEFIEDVPGWSGTRLSTLELFALSAEFWNGEEYDDPDRLMRTEAAVGEPTRRDAE